MIDRGRTFLACPPVLRRPLKSPKHHNLPKSGLVHTTVRHQKWKIRNPIDRRMCSPGMRPIQQSGETQQMDQDSI